MPHADAHRSGAGASIFKESACDRSLQVPCITAYGRSTLPNALSFFVCLFLMFKHKHVNLPQGVL